MAKDGKKRKVQETESATKFSLSDQDLADLADGLTKEQLVSLARDAAVSHTDIQSKLRKLADEDPASRKLFVRGLNFSTDKDGLKKVFDEYGNVEDVVVVVDKSTGKNKGFGFVTFKHKDAALRALKEPNKKIDGRSTICYLSREGETSAAATAAPPILQVSPENMAFSRKVYVGNVPKNAQKSTLKTFFSKFGEIEEGPLGWDKKTGKCKGYALIVYKTIESVKKCLQEPSKTFEGHKLQVKLADTQKDKEDKVNAGMSALGYDVTNPALIASHNPSFLQSGTPGLGRLPSELGALHGIDPLMTHPGVLLGRESALAAGSLSSLYGLPLNNALHSTHPSLAALHDARGLGLSTLPRGALY